MIIGFKIAQSILWLVLQTGLNELIRLLTDSIVLWTVLWKIYFPSHRSWWYIFLPVHIVSKWLLSIKHLEEDNPDWPNVNLAWILRILCLEDLRRQIRISAHARSCDVSFWFITLDLLAYAEVKDLYNTMMKEDVCWFQVKVNNFIILFLQVFDPAQHLPYDVLWLSFIQASESPEIGAKLRTWTILHHKTISVIGIELIKHLHYIWMGQLSMYLDLFVQKFVKSLVLCWYATIIGKNFDSNVLVSLDVKAFVDFAKASIAN